MKFILLTIQIILLIIGCIFSHNKSYEIARIFYIISIIFGGLTLLYDVYLSEILKVVMMNIMLISVVTFGVIILLILLLFLILFLKAIINAIFKGGE